MNKSTSLAALAVATSAFLLGGCDTDSSDLGLRMVEQSVDEGHAFGMQRDMLHLTRSIDWDLPADEIAETIADALGDCAAVQGDETSSFAIALGDTAADATCSFSGRTYVGAITIAAEEVDGVITIAHAYDLESEDGEASMLGTTTIVATDDEHHFASEVEVSRRGRTRVMSGERTEVPLDPTVGFDGGTRVDGSRTMESERGTRTQTLSGLEFFGDELVPQAGTISMEGGRRSISMSFSRVDDSTVQATVEGRRGEFVATVDAETGEILSTEGSLGRGRPGAGRRYAR